MVLCAVVLLLSPGLSAQDATLSAAELAQERQRSALTQEHIRSIQRRRAVMERRKRSTPHQFVAPDGGVTLTNRPEKYRQRDGLTETRLKYEPINVPAQYRKYKAPKDYASGTIQEIIKRYATVYQLDENLIYAVIKCESNFNPNAVSRAGACGLMQLMPGTAAEMHVTKPFDPAQNIAGGTQYLRKMLDLFKGDKQLALAGYNAGPQTVKKYGGVPPYAETRAYVKNVLRWYSTFGGKGAATKGGYIARVRTAPPRQRVDFARGNPYVLHFHSGLTQPADDVTEKDGYYNIKYGGRVYTIPKDLVKKVEKAA